MPKKEPWLAGRRILAENLRRERLAQGLTQEQLAERSGLHWTYISEVEGQKRNISIDNITKLALALGFQLWELLSPEVGMSSETHTRRSS
ncbi:MAG: helix-turn-helix transcriptional regulator [Chitinophagaceae bacterium]|nr:helix-turn-helix transcriptional regulator [Chitinophagaceae bacterium]